LGLRTPATNKGFSAMLASEHILIDILSRPAVRADRI
jgi:hypothetical protein